MTTARHNKQALLRPLAALAALLLFLAQSQPAHAATITVSTTADELNSDGDCALREAIQAANTDAAVDACPAGSGADTIVVPAGTYTRSIAGAGEDANASGDLDITASLTINGAGAATTIVDGAALDRVLHIIGGTSEISGVTIQNGSEHFGGGIFNSGMLTLNDSTVSGNSAAGGAITNVGTLELTGSTVSGNQGPGILNAVFSSNHLGTAMLTNSTVSGNQGSGIVNHFGTLTTNSSTVSGNTALDTNGGGIGNHAHVDFGGTATLKNTIVANNTGGDCYFGPITSAGHNLSSDGTCPFTTPGDLQNTNPLLGPLADNGGPTQTHALLPGSPAIDAGSSDCPPPFTDQRGVARPQGVACDIGAFELVLVVTVTIDIKPGSFPNSINAGSEGVIPVAILTTPTFDAATVNPLSVKLEGASVRLKGKSGNAGSLEDVDGDGDLDLVVQIVDWTLSAGTTTATLTGQTFDGTPIQGSDSVNVVP